MNWRGRAAALIVALGVSACASFAPPGPLGGDSLSGRLAVKVDADGTHPARSENANFELLGGPDTGRMNLSTPLGSVLAQARWSPGSVVLTTPQGEQRFADMDSLTRAVLGESVPVAALFDWLRGRPWSGAPSVPNSPPAAAGFSQAGWNVDLDRYGDGVIVAQRNAAPSVTVRAKIDR